MPASHEEDEGKVVFLKPKEVKGQGKQKLDWLKVSARGTSAAFKPEPPSSVASVPDDIVPDSVGGPKIIENPSDPYAYYIEPPGTKGVSVRCKLDPVLRGHITQLLQSGKTIFKTEDDLIRAGVHLIMRTLAGYDRELNDDIRHRDRLAILAQRNKRAKDTQLIVENAIDAVATPFEDNSRPIAVKTWLTVLEICDAYTQPYGVQMLSKILSAPKLANFLTWYKGLTPEQVQEIVSK